MQPPSANYFIANIAENGLRNRPPASAIGLRAPLSKSRRTLDLVEPIEAHVFDDAIAHHDDAAFLAGIGDVLVQRERRDVDIVAARPFEFLRRLGPLPFERFEAVPLEIPVQIV